MSGLIITALFFPLAGCIAGRRTLSECFLLGVGIVGSLMFVLGLFHVPFTVTIGVILVAALPGCLVPKRHNAATRKLGNPATILVLIPLVLLAIPAAIVPLNDFDGRAFWLLKAKALANERAVDGPFFHNEIVNDPRNQYPLLVPLDAAAIMMAAGESDDRQVRWFYLFTFAALVFFVRRRIGPWYAAILAWTPQFAVNNEGGALTAYSDIVIAAFVACAFFALLDARSPFRFGLWLSFLVLTKNEGLPIALILLAIGSVSFRRRIIGSIAPLATAMFALLVWRSGIPRTDEENYAALLRGLPEHLGRIVPALAASAKHFFLVSNWGLLWIAALIALAVLAWRGEWRAPAIVVSVFAVYITAYVVTRWNMPELIVASADRLLMHMIGPAMFAIARVTDAIAQNRYIPSEYRPR